MPNTPALPKCSRQFRSLSQLCIIVLLVFFSVITLHPTKKSEHLQTPINLLSPSRLLLVVSYPPLCVRTQGRRHEEMWGNDRKTGAKGKNERPVWD